VIIDAHAHVFPHHGSPAGYKDIKTHLMMQQALIERFWGRMITNTLDKKYVPYSDEDVNFRVGKYGRYEWTKHGKECWLQRFPTIMVEMEFPPEHMIALMDGAGVDKAVLQAGYMEMNFCLDYFVDIFKKYPGRFIGTIMTDYDIDKGEDYRKSELMKLRNAVLSAGIRGVHQGYPREQKADDKRFEPFWSEISNLNIPHIFWTGFMPKMQYLDSLERIEKVLRKFPGVIAIIGHLGGNVRPADDPNYTDTPSELINLLKLSNVYFEVGYVLAYENWQFWKENYEYPYPLHTKLIKRVYDEVGPERLLWSSDMPNTYRTCTYLQCMDLVRLHFDFLNKEEKDLVLGGNASKLFKV